MAGKSEYHRDSPTLTDSLEFGDYLQALGSIVNRAETPLTVGVFGTWGAGKTSLMKMLHRGVQEGANCRAVWFTAWKYHQQDALWRALVLRVIDALYPRADGTGPYEQRDRKTDLASPQERKLVEQLDRLQDSVYRQVDWTELGKLTVDWAKAAAGGTQAAAEIADAFFFPGAGFLAKALKALQKNPEDASVLSRQVRNFRLEQLRSMEQFESTFADVVRDTLGKNGRLVVFVDDLDRCLPEKAVEILEAIKLFLEVPGTVFVLGMHREVIEQGIDFRYREMFRGSRGTELPITGDSYLQKMIQIPFHLPPLGDEEVAGFIEGLEKGRIDETTRQVFSRGLYPNPRQVKRVLNIFRLLREIALAREERGRIPKESVAWPLLAKAVVIQTQYPNLYARWRLMPTLVKTLEERFESRGGEGAPTGVDVDVDTPEFLERREDLVDQLLRPYLEDRLRYQRLEALLSHPPADQAGEGRQRARFDGLDREQLRIYVALAGVSETGTASKERVAVPEDLLMELTSGDTARVREAAEQVTDPGEKDEAARQLLAIMRKEEDPRPARERVAAGLGLALLGDPRREILEPAEIEWIEIPAGPFHFELNQRQFEIPYDYRISRYPVTNSQFGRFREARGNHDWKDFGAPFNLPNHPAVGVSWHAAVAFCDWLTELLRFEGAIASNQEARLPSEPEWEKACRPGSKHEDAYPWGESFDPERANGADTGIGTTSAVGCFPLGRGRGGTEEMIGNAWEWTRSLEAEGPYPESSEDWEKREARDGRGGRVLRGGSVYDPAEDLRAGARRGNLPVYRYYLIGFRVVVASYGTDV